MRHPDTSSISRLDAEDFIDSNHVHILNNNIILVAFSLTSMMHCLVHNITIFKEPSTWDVTLEKTSCCSGAHRG